MAEQHPDPDLVVELALGHLTGPQRDAVVSHVTDCPTCRRELDELSGALEATLAAVPRTEPRPGFTAAVLDRLEVRGPVGAQRRRVPAWVGVAAAALLGLGAGSGLTLALGDGLGGAPVTETPVVTAGAGLTTEGGERVGTVSRSWSEGSPVLVVDISAGEAGRSYLCRLRLADGGTMDAGRWTLSPDRPNSWVVPDPGVRGVELVTDSGRVWSSVTL